MSKFVNSPFELSDLPWLRHHKRQPFVGNECAVRGESSLPVRNLLHRIKHRDKIRSNIPCAVGQRIGQAHLLQDEQSPFEMPGLFSFRLSQLLSLPKISFAFRSICAIDYPIQRSNAGLVDFTALRFSRVDLSPVAELPRA